MRTYVFVMTLCLALPAPAGEPPETTRKQGKSEAVKRLERIEKNIRDKQSESDEEVRRAKEEVKRIKKEAAEESAKIKAESDTYTQQVQREIEEIQKRHLAGDDQTPVLSDGAPSREGLSAALQSLVDPLMPCWQPTFPVSARPKPAAIESCVMDRVRKRLKGYFGR